MVHELTEAEGRLMRNMVLAYQEAVHAAAKAEAAVRAAIAALCAAHNLEGEWRLNDDMSRLVRVEEDRDGA